MSQVTASKLLNIVNTLEGMIHEVTAKQTFLKHKIKECKTQRELELIKNTTKVLSSEMDNINVTIDMVCDLHAHLAVTA